MPFIHYSPEKFRDLHVDDYRSYLISRNQPPILYHSRDMHFRRLQVHLRAAGRQIKAVLHWVAKAFAASRRRRIQRELSLHDGRYRRAPDDIT
jgi:hypothetical protein